MPVFIQEEAGIYVFLRSTCQGRTFDVCFFVGGLLVGCFGLLLLFRVFFLTVSRNSLQHFLSSLLQQKSRAGVSKERQSSL